MEYFIKGTDKQYSISDKGIVYSHYRFRTNGKKLFRKQVVSKCADLRDGKPISVKVVFLKKAYRKSFNVNNLMAECFNLTPPDKHHLYRLKPKDNDLFNNSLENLEWRIKTNKTSEYKFYPQPFYNRSGKIVSKICGECGDKKIITDFTLQKPRSPGQHWTYLNVCKICRAKRQWKRIKTDPIRYDKHLKHIRKWSKTEKGKRYYKNYRKISQHYQKVNLTRHYIASSLRVYKFGISEKEIPEELINLRRSIISLKRVINKVKPKTRWQK